jgi:hypothetical protein
LAPKTLVILKADSWHGSSWLLSLCIAFLCSHILLELQSVAAAAAGACCTFFGRLAVLLCGLQTPADTPRENSRVQAHRHTPQKQTTSPSTPQLLPSGLPTAAERAAWVRHCAGLRLLNFCSCACKCLGTKRSRKAFGGMGCAFIELYCLQAQHLSLSDIRMHRTLRTRVCCHNQMLFKYGTLCPRLPTASRHAADNVQTHQR